MPGQNVPTNSFRKLWMSGLAVHLVMLFFVLDLYFKSPVTHGMDTHKQDVGFAKRAVIIIADGLRAEALYDANEYRTPYLTEVRNGKSSWGTVHTRVPTESRPGHVAILAGLYEDPSAIFTGWQTNIVEFDSIINQSTNAWSYGSPDIVEIFKKHDEVNHICESYDPKHEDFSGKLSTTILDQWVFNKVEDLLSLDVDSCHGKYMMLKRAERIVSKQQEQNKKRKRECLVNKETCSGTSCYMREQICNTEYEAEQVPVRIDNYTVAKDIDELQKSEACKDITLDCGPLCDSGNIFFMHLLGMDSAGHIHKPDSKEYLENLHVVDEGIKRTYKLFEDYYGDNETVYIFTSDHGMTNWGSHGDGSDHETKVPYIIWGKGIKDNVKNHDMEQADLTPLIAALIGIPIPVNSVGNLHHQLLDGTEKQVAQALFTNMKQIAEQYLVLKENYKKDVFYFEHAAFRRLDLEQFIIEIGEYFNDENMEADIVKYSVELLEQLHMAIKYTKDYYFYPKMTCAMVGFIMWMVALLASVFSNPPRPRCTYINKYYSLKTSIQRISIFMTCTLWIYLYNIGSDIMCFVYPVFPVIVLLSIMEDNFVVYKIITMPYNKNVYKILITYVIYAILVQLLVLGFFNKIYYGIIFVLLSLWVQKFNSKSSTKICWMISCLSLSFLLLLPTSTQFSYMGFVVGVIFWLSYYIKFIHNDIRKYINANFFKAGKLWNIFSYIPLILFITSALNTILVAYTFDNEQGVYSVNKYLSWLLTVCAIASIFISPTNIYGRFGQICACLIVPFTLTSINIDLLVYTIIVATLHLWISIEAYAFKVDLNFEQYDVIYDLSTLSKGSSSNDFRTTFFYLAIIIGYYFAIGNLASFNGFDPLWSRAYITTFNPIIMCMVIIFKMIIPFFIITCAFHTVNLITKRNMILTFTILLLYCDQMVLNFIFQIKNEGSWAQIGQSLSHFAIMEVMILVMSLFYASSYYVTKQKIWFHKRLEEVDMDAIFKNEYDKQQKTVLFFEMDGDLEDVFHDQMRSDKDPEEQSAQNDSDDNLSEVIARRTSHSPVSLTYESRRPSDINQPTTSRSSGNRNLGKSHLLLSRSISNHSMTTRSRSRASTSVSDTQEFIPEFIPEIPENIVLARRFIEGDSSSSSTSEYFSAASSLVNLPNQPTLTLEIPLINPRERSARGRRTENRGARLRSSRIELPLRRVSVQLHDVVNESSILSGSEFSTGDEIFVTAENTTNEMAEDSDYDDPQGVIMIDPRGSLAHLVGNESAEGVHFLDRVEGMVPLEGGPSLYHERPSNPSRIRKSLRLQGLNPEQFTVIKGILEEEERKKNEQKKQLEEEEKDDEMLNEDENKVEKK